MNRVPIQDSVLTSHKEEEMRPGVSGLYSLLTSELGLQEGGSTRASVLAAPGFLSELKPRGSC